MVVRGLVVLFLVMVVILAGCRECDSQQIRRNISERGYKYGKRYV